MKFFFLKNFNSLQLDIVGIVAVLGEGSTSRNSQASALSWHHILPRLLPAPQALLKHELERRLPTRSGLVIGPYSGNQKNELNFFCQLLHPDDLAANQVEWLEVTHRLGDDGKPIRLSNGQAFGIRRFCRITALSILGSLMALGLIVTAIVLKDGFSLIATLLLSVTSTLVGLASWWKLVFEEEQPKKGRENNIPDADVIIYYPNGSFRVVKCKEPVARLYFKREQCQNICTDNQYRFLAIVASMFLMAGLLCMGNAQTPLQVSFAGYYIILNVLYWGTSALNPFRHHWEHCYQVTKLKFRAPTQPKKSLPKITVELHEDNSRDKSYVESISSLKAGPDTIATVATQHNGQVIVDSTNGRILPTHHRPRRIITFDTDRKPDAVDGQANKPAPQLDAAGAVGQPEKTSNNLSIIRTTSRRNTSDSFMAKVPFVHRLTMPLRAPSRVMTDESPEYEEDRTYTAALWQVIALTGNTHWLKMTNIAPSTAVWARWIEEAGKNAESKVKDGKIIPAMHRPMNQEIAILPTWRYQAALNRLFREEKNNAQERSKTRAPPRPYELKRIVMDLSETRSQVKGLDEWTENRLRELAAWARQNAVTNSVHRVNGDDDKIVHPPLPQVPHFSASRSKRRNQ